MVMSLGILTIHKMSIVRTDKLHAILLSQFYKHLVSLLLQRERLTIGADIRISHFVALKLQIVVVAPQTFMPLYSLAGTGNITL